MSDAQKIATVLPEVKKLVEAETAAPVADPIAPVVAAGLGLDKPVEAPKIEEQKKAGYVDTTKLAPKKEGYAPETENKKFFDFIQDRYRSGSLGVAPGYNFYSDSPLYNDQLVEEYKKRYPELAAEYAANPDAGKYSPVSNPSTENKHELADFWDYAAGRQEKDDLKNLYMYGFKSDDPRATPEILQRLKDENPWLYEEYLKRDQTAAAPAPGDAVPPDGDIPKPAGSQDDGKLTAEVKEKKVPDILGELGKMGYSAPEILQAGLAGRAGITDFDQTSAGRRVLSEKEAKSAADKKAETAEERAFQEKLMSIQDANDTRRMMADQTFQSAMIDKGYSQDEKVAIANHARELEKMGYDRDTAIILADKAAAAATQSAAIKAGSDPYGLAGMDTLDQLFKDGKITPESYNAAKAEQEKAKGAEIEAKGKEAYKEIFGEPDQNKPVPGQFAPPVKPVATVPAPGVIPPPPVTQTPPMSIEQALAKLKTPAEKQKFLMNAGFKELPGSGGLWQGPAINGQPGKAVKI